MTITADVTKNLLTCVLWVLKNVERDSLQQWLGELSVSRLATLLHLLDACTGCFEYRPKQRAPPPSGYTHAQSQDVKSRLEDIILGQGSAREMMQRRKGIICPKFQLKKNVTLWQHFIPLTSQDLHSQHSVQAGNSKRNQADILRLFSGGGQQGGTTEKLRWRKEQMAYRPTYDNPERHKESILNDAYLEGHLSTEASFVILDTLERCVTTVAQWDSQQHLIGLALSVLLHALGKNQSTTVLPHLFASQRSLVFKVIACINNYYCLYYVHVFSFTARFSTKKTIIAPTCAYFY